MKLKEREIDEGDSEIERVKRESERESERE
jgi:hypothetical protein